MVNYSREKITPKKITLLLKPIRHEPDNFIGIDETRLQKPKRILAKLPMVINNKLNKKVEDLKIQIRDIILTGVAIVDATQQANDLVSRYGMTEVSLPVKDTFPIIADIVRLRITKLIGLEFGISQEEINEIIINMINKPIILNNQQQPLQNNDRRMVRLIEQVIKSEMFKYKGNK